MKIVNNKSNLSIIINIYYIYDKNEKNQLI